MDWLNRLKQIGETIPKQVIRETAAVSPIFGSGQAGTKEQRVAKSQKRLCYWLQQEVQDCQLPCWAWSRDRGDGRTCPHFRAYMRQRKNIPFQCESFREPGDDSGCSHYQQTGECQPYNQIIEWCLEIDLEPLKQRR